MLKDKYDVYNQNCPSRQALEIISDKWTILIVNLLARNTYRFGELKRQVGGISQKVLTQTLRMLEKNGFVLRKNYQTLPLKVEYSLTPLGLSLSAVFNLITDWAEQNIETVMQARQVYQESIENQ